jgi:hypothetical protein
MGERRFLCEFVGTLPEDLAAAAHRTRDGKELPAAGAGTLATEKFRLSGVLYFPGILTGTVLVSVKQLAGSGYLVMFGAGRCVVMDRGGGKLVGEGRLPACKRTTDCTGSISSTSHSTTPLPPQMGQVAKLHELLLQQQQQQQQHDLVLVISMP